MLKSFAARIRRMFHVWNYAGSFRRCQVCGKADEYVIGYDYADCCWENVVPGDAKKHRFSVFAKRESV